MTEFRFAVRLAPASAGEDLEELGERIYARTDDTTVTGAGAAITVRFTRVADSFETAVASALADLESDGLAAERIEIEPADVRPHAAAA